jgi:hypothetical protein
MIVFPNFSKTIVPRANETDEDVVLDIMQVLVNKIAWVGTEGMDDGENFDTLQELFSVEPICTRILFYCSFRDLSVLRRLSNPVRALSILYTGSECKKWIRRAKLEIEEISNVRYSPWADTEMMKYNRPELMSYVNLGNANLPYFRLWFFTKSSSHIFFTKRNSPFFG